MDRKLENLIGTLRSDRTLPKDGFERLISALSGAGHEEERGMLYALARKTREERFGKGVYKRGLVELSSYCVNDCNYCGIRAGNGNASRYRLSDGEILAACAEGYGLGFRTFVLQGGEDPAFTPDRVSDLVRRIKFAHPDCAVTLSLGEASRAVYAQWRAAGADRYLLRHETADAEHYRMLHPPSMDPGRRRRCLFDLRELGYQVGTGFMVGSPYQNAGRLAADLLFVRELDPQMVGVGPFIPHRDTVYKDFPAGSVEQTLVMIALLRLMLPDALIPATTALGTAAGDGRERGVLAGANVVMPNLTPVKYRGRYMLYDGKICTGEEAAECSGCLALRMSSIGCELLVSRGDHVPAPPALPKYDPYSPRCDEFINDAEITDTLSYAEAHRRDAALAGSILAKAAERKGLTHREAAVLLVSEVPGVDGRIKSLAREIKEAFYGRRVVFFAPLYLSNHCVNGCVYCPYHTENGHMPRRKLTQDEIRREVVALQDMGHKRLAVELGEDPANNPLEYLLESIETIYSVRHRNGSIRRVNVNIAATTVENYRRLHDAGIGTYILFQETYNRRNYEALHPSGPKSDYARQTEAMDRAMDGGIDDVGLGVLFGLESYKYDFVGLLMHAEHLEAAKGVGPHTISVPRIRPADGIDVADFKDAVPDGIFERIVALIRIAVPYTGMIMSTRESVEMRARALELGVSQLSGASRTSVGGYALGEEEGTSQFDIDDGRTLDEVVSWLADKGHIPSFCTACYREGRTGDRFMSLVKRGAIANICQPNALMTFKEYLEDYARPATREKGMKLIAEELVKIPSDRVRTKASEYLTELEDGKRDFRF